MLGDFSANTKLLQNFFQKFSGHGFPKFGNRVVIDKNQEESQVKQIATDRLEIGSNAPVEQAAPTTNNSQQSQVSVEDVLSRLDDLAGNLESNLMDLSYEQVEQAVADLEGIQSDVDGLDLDDEIRAQVDGLLGTASEQLGMAASAFESTTGIADQVAYDQSAEALANVAAGLQDFITTKETKARQGLEAMRDTLAAQIGELDDAIETEKTSKTVSSGGYGFKSGYGSKFGYGWKSGYGSKGSSSNSENVEQLTDLRDQAATALARIEADLASEEDLDLKIHDRQRELRDLESDANNVAYRNRDIADVARGMADEIDKVDHSADSDVTTAEKEMLSGVENIQSLMNSGDFEGAKEAIAQELQDLGGMGNRIGSELKGEIRAGLETALQKLDSSIGEIPGQGGLEVMEMAGPALENIRAARDVLGAADTKPPVGDAPDSGQVDPKPEPAPKRPPEPLPDVAMERMDASKLKTLHRRRTKIRLGGMISQGTSQINQMLQNMDKPMSMKDLGKVKFSTPDSTMFQNIMKSAQKTSEVVRQRAEEAKMADGAKSAEFERLAEKMAEKGKELAKSLKNNIDKGSKADMLKGYSMDDIDQVYADEKGISESAAAEAMGTIENAVGSYTDLADAAEAAQVTAQDAQASADAAQLAADEALVAVEEATTEADMEAAMEASTAALQAAQEAKVAAREAFQAARGSFNALKDAHANAQEALAVLDQEQELGLLSEETIAQADEMRALFEENEGLYADDFTRARDAKNAARDARDSSVATFQNVVDVHGQTVEAFDAAMASEESNPSSGPTVGESMAALAGQVQQAITDVESLLEMGQGGLLGLGGLSSDAEDKLNAFQSDLSSALSQINSAIGSGSPDEHKLKDAIDSVATAVTNLASNQWVRGGGVQEMNTEEQALLQSAVSTATDAMVAAAPTAGTGASSEEQGLHTLHQATVSAFGKVAKSVLFGDHSSQARNDLGNKLNPMTNVIKNIHDDIANENFTEGAVNSAQAQVGGTSFGLVPFAFGDQDVADAVQELSEAYIATGGASGAGEEEG